MKRFPHLRKIYWAGYRWFWKTYATCFPVSATKTYYKKKLGYVPDLKNPHTLNEKLQYLKLTEYRHNPLVTQCADKIEVRKYVESVGCAEILNEVYGVYDSATEINWNDLPDTFVIKCNHDSGGILICKEKDTFDTADATQKLDTWLKARSGVEHVEFSYEDIKPRILCEKYIDSEDGKPPRDYKIFCSYGEPKLLFVATDREHGHTKFDYFTPEWEWIDVRNGHPNAGPSVKKPERLDDMLDYARKLSKGFPIVRVDLYCEFNQIIFGELTFLHFGGVTPFDPVEYDRIFGNLFPLKGIDE